MSATNEALARRWMASKHWGGWRVGMVCLDGCVMSLADEWGPMTVDGDAIHRLPDLDHPGTRAFMLEDVRRAWGEPLPLSCLATGAPSSPPRLSAPTSGRATGTDTRGTPKPQPSSPLWRPHHEAQKAR